MELITGIYANMSNADYHSHPHIGSSGFKRLAQSPAHFWQKSPLNPDKPKDEPSAIMRIGSAWHTGIWEPHLFDSAYAARPDISANSTVYALLMLALEDFPAFQASHVALPDGLGKTTKEGKALIAALQEQGKTGVEADKFQHVMELVPPLLGKTLLPGETLEHVKDMVHAARLHPVTRAIFEIPGGMSEHSIFWIDEDTGAPCRIRPDYMLAPCMQFPHGLIIDGKSNDDSSAETFGRNSWNSEMFYQAAFYCDGFQHHYGTSEPPLFAWLSQEREAPYATAYYSAPADFVQYGRSKYRRLLRTFAYCLQENTWPGYPMNVTELSVPLYAARAISDELGGV